MHLSRAEFESLVQEALDSLPARFSALLENVVIVVEEEPSEEDLDALYGDSEDDEENVDDQVDDDRELLGIYRGVALTRRTHDMFPMLPDQIAIFRGPILRVARDRRDAVQEIRDTVIHELGHYFGLHDADMPY